MKASGSNFGIVITCPPPRNVGKTATFMNAWNIGIIQIVFGWYVSENKRNIFELDDIVFYQI